MAEMGRQLLAQTGEYLGGDLSRARVQHKDIYSCFPVAVSVVARELGIGAELSDGAQLTVTGGLPFHGGPGSNYSMHGVVAMVAKLREQPVRA